MRYDKVVFNDTLAEGYQEIEFGSMLRLTDLNGATIDPDKVTSYTVTQAEAPTPIWGTPDA